MPMCHLLMHAHLYAKQACVKRNVVDNISTYYPPKIATYALYLTQ